MFWFILTNLFLAISIKMFMSINKEEYDSDLIATGIFILLFCSLGTGLTAVHFTIKWTTDSEKYKIIETTIENKLKIIELTKKSYIETQKEMLGTVNINLDMVNKDLTINISNQYRDLEKYIEDCNIGLSKWKISHKYWFWSNCYTKLIYDKPIMLSDYIK